MLRDNYGAGSISNTEDFRRDLRWFTKFLAAFNGTSIYIHRPVDDTIDLDACLIILGGSWKNYVYHLHIPRHFENLSIVHLKVFGPFRSEHRILVNCDNQALVAALTNGGTKDPLLSACA